MAVRFVKRSNEIRGAAGAVELKNAYEFTLDVLGQVYVPLISLSSMCSGLSRLIM